MIVSDKSVSLQITGNGDVLEPADDVIGALPAPRLGRPAPLTRASPRLRPHSHRVGRAVCARCVYTTATGG